MLIAVFANDDQWNELLEYCDEARLIRMHTESGEVKADGYLVLDEQKISTFKNLLKPVIINSVIHTLTKLQASKNTVRINGWSGFLQRKSWEVAGVVTDEVKQIFTALGRHVIEVADVPGLVAVRPIGMLINEAYFALEEQVSTKAEIDIAMKLGTSYPYGPFEWGSRIGLKNIHDLLVTLSITDSRYFPAPLLKKESTA